MPTYRPEWAAGHYYHLFNRGAHQTSIFREEENHHFVLRTMKQFCRSLSLAPIAYCLLPNHYHWLIRQDGEQPAGLLPQLVFNSYSKAYNKRYEHSGTLFQGNYQVKPIEEDGYLLHLCRYIHANAAVHQLVEDVADWPYSNYLEWIGERPGTLVDRTFVQEHFPIAADYQSFVARYIVERRLPQELETYIRVWER